MQLVQGSPHTSGGEDCNGSPRQLSWTPLPPPNLTNLTRKPMTLELLCQDTSVRGEPCLERSDLLHTSTKAGVEGRPVSKTVEDGPVSKTVEGGPVGKTVDGLGKSFTAVNHRPLPLDEDGHRRTGLASTSQHPTTQRHVPEASQLTAQRRESYDRPSAHRAFSTTQRSFGVQWSAGAPSSDSKSGIDGSATCSPAGQTTDVASYEIARGYLTTREREEVDGNAVSMMAAAQIRGKDSSSSSGPVSSTGSGKPSVATPHKPGLDRLCSAVISPDLVSPDPTVGDYVDPCDDLTLDMLVDDDSSDDGLPSVNFSNCPRVTAVTAIDKGQPSWAGQKLERDGRSQDGQPSWTGQKHKREEGKGCPQVVMSVPTSTVSHGDRGQAMLQGGERGQDGLSTFRPGANAVSMMAAQVMGEDSLSSSGPVGSSGSGKPSVAMPHKPGPDRPCSAVSSPDPVSPDPTVGDYVDPCDDLTLDMLVDDDSSDDGLPSVNLSVCPQVTAVTAIDKGQPSWVRQKLERDGRFQEGQPSWAGHKRERDEQPSWAGHKWERDEGKGRSQDGQPSWAGQKRKGDGEKGRFQDVMSVPASTISCEDRGQARLQGGERGRDGLSTFRPGADLPSSSGEGRGRETRLQLPDSCLMCGMRFPRWWVECV